MYHFICLEKTKSFYKILINDNETGYIPNNKNYYFKSWDSVLLSLSVERIDKKKPIRKEANTKSKIIEYKCQHESLKVIDVIEKKGEFWLYVSFPENCSAYPDEKDKKIFGWIKWRNDKELFVFLQLLC